MICLTCHQNDGVDLDTGMPVKIVLSMCANWECTKCYERRIEREADEPLPETVETPRD